MDCKLDVFGRIRNFPVIREPRTKRALAQVCASGFEAARPLSFCCRLSRWNRERLKLMELAYADAFGIPTFVLLHHLTVDQLRRAEKVVPPLVLERNCTRVGSTTRLEWLRRSAYPSAFLLRRARTLSCLAACRTRKLNPIILRVSDFRFRNSPNYS